MCWLDCENEVEMSEEEKRTYQSATLGLPPLKMVLVHIHDDHTNTATKTIPAAIEPEEEIADDEVAVHLIVRLIEHLNKE